MRLLPEGTKFKTSWGIAALACAVLGLGLMLGVPAPEGCGGMPQDVAESPAAPQGQVATALKASDCGEVTVTRQGTCVDPDGSGVRVCQAEDTPSDVQCPQGCQPGSSTFSWKDEFGEEQKAKPSKDFSAMCANRKPPGLDCSFVEHIPCSTTK